MIHDIATQQYLITQRDMTLQDLTSVQNLQKKHTLLESDVGSHQDRLESITTSADQFSAAGHFDADNISSKRDAVQERYRLLIEPLQGRFVTSPDNMFLFYMYI